MIRRSVSSTDQLNYWWTREACSTSNSSASIIGGNKKMLTEKSHRNLTTCFTTQAVTNVSHQGASRVWQGWIRAVDWIEWLQWLVPIFSPIFSAVNLMLSWSECCSCSATQKTTQFQARMKGNNEIRSESERGNNHLDCHFHHEVPFRYDHHTADERVNASERKQITSNWFGSSFIRGDWYLDSISGTKFLPCGVLGQPAHFEPLIRVWCSMFHYPWLSPPIKRKRVTSEHRWL